MLAILHGVTTVPALVDDFIRDELDEAPVLASALGIPGYDDRLGDYSVDAFARRAAKDDAWVAKFDGALADGARSLDDRIDCRLALSALRGRQLLRDWQVWRRNPDTYLVPGLQGVFTLFLHRLRSDDELAASATARLRAVPAVLRDGIVNLDPALASPHLVRRALGQCNAAVKYARELVPTEVAPGAARDVLADAGDVAARAYAEFALHLEKLAEAADGSYAIGEECYSALLREREMLGFDARELRERGREQFDTLERDLTARARRLQGTDDWRAVLDELNADCPETPEAMRDAYDEWTQRARQFLVDHRLVTIPDGERCIVEPSPPFQRPVLAVASYARPPAFTGSRVGHFFVPFPPDGTPADEIRKRLQSNSFTSIPTTAVHEAYPGHHWHLATMAGTDRPLRKIFGTPYFSEGWGLYAERMMLEQGFFEDPRHAMGHVEARIFRAARIVVDTSLHFGEMSVDEAVEFMHKNAGLSEPTARAEVMRYCSWPTQASAYLTGSLEIERIREGYLGAGRGDLRAFHDTIASSGFLPIALAEAAVMGTDA
jgi:uncharacterized protein (DUF885 family)